MARKAKHDQRNETPGFVCLGCQAGTCNQCIDIMRVATGMTGLLCKCKRRNHDGEPVNQQITDPETGTVWAPGLRVTQEGEVIMSSMTEEGIVVEEVTGSTDDPSSVRPVENYRYRDAQLNIIWVTSVPKDDEAAVAYFHSLMRFGKGFRPVYLEKNFADANQGEDYIMLPFVFDPDTRTTEER